MRDLKTLPGDTGSVGLGNDDAGSVVGASLDAEGNPRGFLWGNGVMTDLNTLVPANSPSFLLFAGGINSRGEIAGFGVQTGAPHEVHSFLAVPSNATAAESLLLEQSGRSVLTEDVRNRIRERLPLGRMGSREQGQ